jgi:hypothetical protein
VPGTPDVIWLNGAFGIGKTSVAEELVGRLEGACLLDLEVVGGMLQSVVVPIEARGVGVRHFTLTAPPSVVRARLEVRDADLNQWAKDRIDRCIERLDDQRFAEHLPLSDHTRDELARSIAARLAA